MISLLRIGPTDQSFNRAQRVQPSKGCRDISIDQLFAVAVPSDLILYRGAGLLDVRQCVLKPCCGGGHRSITVCTYTHKQVYGTIGKGIYGVV